jgi:hypothetical protein
VQFSLGEFQGQIEAQFRGHVTHKPDRRFESISVRQDSKRKPAVRFLWEKEARFRPVR